MTSQCSVCGKEFYSKGVMRSHMSSKHPDKFEESKSIVDVVCDFCGKEFEKKEKEVTENNFCDRDCQISWIREEASGRNDYCDNWDKVRESVLRKKGDSCKECGWEYGVQIHHKNGDKSDNRMENLVPLCASCHRKKHLEVNTT